MGVSLMSYLIRTHDDQLILLNNSAKMGLYSQTLSASGLSRPVIIHRGNPNTYSATIDNKQDLHIITKVSQEQIIHLHYKSNNLTRTVLLEDPKGIYHFSNLHAISVKSQVHLFYTANKPIGDSSELIHHILCQEDNTETHPILSFTSTPLGFRYMSYNDIIYLLYAEVSTEYQLKLMMYKDDKWSQPLTAASSSFPIDDFQFCISHSGHIHLLYVQEKYGRYQLIYKKQGHSQWSEEIILHSTATTPIPCIFTYHRGIWVNFIDNSQLQMILSMDHGNTFSKSVSCSLKTRDFERCHFICASGALPASFNANMLYISFSQSLRAGIIAHIDMINFHPDMNPNTELELFIDGVFYSLSKNLQSASEAPIKTDQAITADQSTDLANLETENQELKQIQEQMISQYNDMTELTKKIQEEGKRWRDKSLSLESQLEAARNLPPNP